MSIARYSDLYEREPTHWWCQGMGYITRSLVEGAGFAPGARVLDAGCGAGGLALAWQGRYWIIGLDASRLALDYACRRGVQRALAGSVARLPFASAAFDLVVCLDVLYHEGVSDNRGALAELRRVLRPGGRLLLRLPAYDWLRGPHDDRMGTGRRFTARSLRREMQEAGFSVERVTYANTLLFPLQAAWRLARVGNGDDFISVGAVLSRVLAGILSAEGRLLRRIDLPFGLSVYGLGRKPAEEGDRR